MTDGLPRYVTLPYVASAEQATIPAVPRYPGKGTPWSLNNNQSTLKPSKAKSKHWSQLQNEIVWTFMKYWYIFGIYIYIQYMFGIQYICTQKWPAAGGALAGCGLSFADDPSRRYLEPEGTLEFLSGFSAGLICGLQHSYANVYIFFWY